MSVQHLVFVRADGATERVRVDAYAFPERWIVRDAVPYQRGEIAWNRPEEVKEPHGALVYVEVEPKRYVYERNHQRDMYESARREFMAMPVLGKEGGEP